MKICFSCGICCYNTEMELSEQDIVRIETKYPSGIKREKFCSISKGFIRLKNIDNRCIFLDSQRNRCKIYDFRPKGCEFYPMIFDQGNNKCILDIECPHNKLFFSHKPKFTKTCKELRRWVKDELLND